MIQNAEQQLMMGKMVFVDEPCGLNGYSRTQISQPGFELHLQNAWEMNIAGQGMSLEVESITHMHSTVQVCNQCHANNCRYLVSVQIWHASKNVRCAHLWISNLYSEPCVTEEIWVSRTACVVYRAQKPTEICINFSSMVS